MQAPAESATLPAMAGSHKLERSGDNHTRSQPVGLSPTRLVAVTGFILIVLAGGALTAWMGRHADHVRRDDLLRQAQTAAAAINPEQVMRLTASAADTASPDYRALCAQLRRIRSVSPDIRFVYLLTGRDGRVVFLAESEPEESDDHSPPGMVYEEASADLAAACGTGRAFTEGPLKDQYGVWVSAFAPVRASGAGPVVAELGMDCNARNWRTAVFGSQAGPLLITLLVAVLWGVLVVWLRFIQSSTRRIAASGECLRVSEERLKAALFGARQCLWDWDPSSEAVYFDPQWGALFGYAKSEAPGHIDAWRGMIHPDDLPAVLGIMRLALGAPETSPFEAEYRVRGKSGEWVWVLDRARVTEYASDGRPVRMTGTLQDITPRKRAEQMLQERANELERFNRLLNAREGRVVELKHEVNRLLEEQGRRACYREGGLEEEAPEAVPGPPVPESDRTMISVMDDLERSNHRLQTEIAEHRETEVRLRELSQAVEQSPVSVIITDTAGVILYVNPAFSDISGFSAAEAMGRTPSILKSGRQPAEFYRTLWDTIRAGNPWRGEFENRRKDGTAIWELAVISPILDPQGRVVRFLAVKQDITERRASDERMRRTASEMEQMNRLMTGREERVLELKAEVNELCRALGRPDAYRVTQRSVAEPLQKLPLSAPPAAGDPRA